MSERPQNQHNKLQKFKKAHSIDAPSCLYFIYGSDRKWEAAWYWCVSVLAKCNQMFGVAGADDDESASVFVRKPWISTNVHKTRNYIHFKRLFKYFKTLTEIPETKISKELPHMYAIVFDEWSLGDAHCVAVFATYSIDHKYRYEKVLLGFSPLEMRKVLTLTSTTTT